MVMDRAHGVDIEEMRGQLLTLDTVRETLAATEPLGEHTFGTGRGVQIEVSEDFATVPDDSNDAVATFRTGHLNEGGREFGLSKLALLETGALPGIPRKLQERTPSWLLQQQLNYWFTEGMADKQFKAMVRHTDEGDVALAMARGTVNPFSNLRLLDELLAGISAKYGNGEVLADYKFHHTLEETHMRLIVPGHVRTIQGTGTADDSWSTGIQLTNSLIGLKKTEEQGYLFRWWCTNGCTDTLASTGTFSRRGGGDPDEAYNWARESVDQILAGLEHTLDGVQDLVGMPVAGDVVPVLRDLFAQYNIPNRERDRVIAAMAENDTTDMYHLMQAVTQVANADGLEARARMQLMQMGGHITHASTARCNADAPCRRLLPEGFQPPAGTDPTAN